jgi:CheY-like chemotaxis protein
MNKVIEVDFLPRETERAFSWLDSLRHAKQQRILIIDTDKNTTHLVKILLERTGRYLVFEENDPDRAHQTARNVRPLMILLDVNMSSTDGGKITAQIGADSELQRTPIVFLTPVVTRADANNSFGIREHAFLAKPIDIQELIKTIERMYARIRNASARDTLL